MTTSDRPVKCPSCGVFFKRSQEEFIYKKGRYYHKQCNEGLSAEDEDKKSLLEYIDKLFKNYEKNQNKINQQIKKFKSEGYTYKGMEITLFYFFEVKDNNLSKAMGGVGIIPFVYKEAESYYITKQKAVENSAKIGNIPVIIKDIKIKNPIKQKRYIIDKNIDISSL